MIVKPALAIGITNPSQFGSLGDLMTPLVSAAIYGGGLLLFLYLLFGGFKYMTAGGDDKAVQEAKKMITNAVIGMVLLFCSYWFIEILQDVLKVEIVSNI
jgi:hypothetical protein